MTEHFRDHPSPDALGGARLVQVSEPPALIPSCVRLCLGLLGIRYPETGEHCARVASLACKLGRELGLPLDEAIVCGFLLHDLGKVGIPEGILLKPGPLTPAEWAVMREHPALGAEILRSVDGFERAVPVVLHHHERWDGAGYPHGLRGTDIPAAARVFAVADAFDAMTEDRPYRPPLAPEHAIEIVVRERGGHFDPDAVDAFAAIASRPGLGAEAPEVARMLSACSNGSVKRSA